METGVFTALAKVSSPVHFKGSCSSLTALRVLFSCWQGWLSFSHMGVLLTLPETLANRITIILSLPFCQRSSWESLYFLLQARFMKCEQNTILVKMSWVSSTWAVTTRVCAHGAQEPARAVQTWRLCSLHWPRSNSGKSYLYITTHLLCLSLSQLFSPSLSAPPSFSLCVSVCACVFVCVFLVRI